MSITSQLYQEPIPPEDLERALKALKDNGFVPLISAEHVKGQRKVFIGAYGFTWRDGSYVESDLTTHQILKKIRSIKNQ